MEASTKRTIVNLLAVFLVTSLIGYLFALKNPELTAGVVNEIAREIVRKIGPVSNYGFEMFLKIFLNNSRVALLMFISGLFFGLGPWFIMATNGFAVGLVVGFSHYSKGLSLVRLLLALLPHGIIEIPAIALAGVSGILWYREAVKGGTAEKRFIRGTERAIKLLGLSILLLLVAAAVETYVTPRVAGL
ncbi:stage II sporulation protein M [Thermococcus sp. P6]|uniref:stage II sporulation protein M n=1 Tax=Thermococcus sp. P6 TaxID=122420 RepID=UPI001E647EEA|nr:stage II sporulation protein M [Thermococcus sp. P6]